MPKQRIVCFGDSITQGQGQAEADRWTAQLAFLLETAFPGTYEVYNRGVGGNTTAMALDRIQGDVAPLLPAVVLIEFGINDAYVYPWSKTPRLSLVDFQMNLSEIIRLVKIRGGTPLLIINHPIKTEGRLLPQGHGISIEENIAPYNRSIRKIANSLQLECSDLPELMKKKKIKPASILAEDGVHLSPDGNRIYGRLIFDQLKKSLPKLISKTRNKKIGPLAFVSS